MVVAGLRPSSSDGSIPGVVAGADKEKAKEPKEKSVKESKDKDCAPSESRGGTSPVHYLPKKRRIQQKFDEEASASSATLIAKKSRVDEPSLLELTVSEAALPPNRQFLSHHHPTSVDDVASYAGLG